MAPKGEQQSQQQQHETAQQAGVSLGAIQANTQQLAAACAALQAQRQARAANINPTRPDESELGRLDSSVKKNGTFIKKLRQLGADNGKQLLTEATKLNLSKYVSEAVISLAEAPLKVADIPAVMDMASALHQRYPDFAASLGPTLAKVAVGAGPGSSKGTPEEERATARRQRGALRLLPELIAAGVLSDAGPCLGAVKSLATTLDFTKAPEPSLTAATLLGACSKAAAPLLLGSPPDTSTAGSSSAGGGGSGGGSGGSSGGCSMPLPQELLHTQDLSGLPADLAPAVAELQQQQKQLQEELKLRYQLPDEQKAQLVKMFDHAFDCCSAALLEAHKALIALDKDNARAYATKGELPEGAAAEYESSRKSYEALHRATASMAEALNKPLPHLAEDAFTRIGHEDAAAAAGAGGSAGGSAADAVEHVFEDPEVRAFYEQLPDLWSLVPTVLLKDATRPRTSEPSGGNKAHEEAEAAAAAQEHEPASAADVDGSKQDDAAAAGGSRQKASAEAAAAVAASGDAKTPSTPTAAEAAAAAAAGDAGDADESSSTAAGAAAASDQVQGVDLILARLSSCVSRDLCDELAVNFCYSNSKGARKRLVRALVEVPRGNLQLLPYYARVAATISQAYPEVGAGVVSAVEGEFDALAAKKDMTRAGEEPRLRVARYLAELGKFRLAAPSSLLLRLKTLLDDFSGGNVEAAATLVENAGRFLLRLPEARVRMDNLLVVMMRLRNARNLDSRQTNAIDNAYFACRPPDKAASRRRKRTPMQEYIHHLIFERLGDGSIVDVLKKLMKLPWSDTEPYLLKCLLKVVRVRFQHIALIASLAGGLAQYHDSLGVGLVDLVLEDVRWGLDHPFAGNYQQRLAQVRLLGEAYNYMLLDSRAVFDVLYMLIGYGHDSEGTALKLDPPDDFFRLRMVIVLLNTCGSYFSKGAAKRRLDRFLTFLQAYVLAKQTMPLDVEADLQDMYDVLRPGLVRFSGYPEAAAAVSDILAKEAAATASGLEPIDEDDDDDSEEEAKVADDTAEDEYEDDEAGDGLDEYDRGEAAAGGPLDDEFEREYLSLMQECQGRPGASLPGAAGLLPLPGVAAASSHPQQQQQQQHFEPDHQQHQQHHQHQHFHHRHQQQQQQHYHDEEYEDAPAVTFKMLMKRGGKDDRTKELHVPADAALAARVLAQKESEEAERSQIKALVLEANERDEAEQQAAAAAARAARAAAFRRGGRGGGQQLYRQRAPGRGAGGRKGPQQGPQLTLAQHVNQLTGGQQQR